MTNNILSDHAGANKQFDSLLKYRAKNIAKILNMNPRDVLDVLRVEHFGSADPPK
jgi:hypothetical protein